MVQLRFSLFTSVAATALLLARAAVAQQAPPPASSIVPELTSGVSVSEEYSDNIYATRTSKTSDWITLVNPFANLRFRGEKGEFNVGGSAAIGRYREHAAENFDDYRVYANSRYNYSPALSFSSGASYDRLHEARSSPDAQPGVNPTIYDITGAYGAAFAKFDATSVRVGATFDRYNYSDVSAIGGGVINNDDRDRDMATVGTRIGHSISSVDELFGIFTSDIRTYRLPFDDFGYEKDSKGLRFSGGLRHRIDSTLDAEAYFGGIYQNYSDPRFANVFVPDFGGRIQWTGIPGTTLTAKLERTIQETDLQGASGYLQTAATFDAVHWIRPNLRVNAGFSYYLNQFNGLSRVDQVESFGIGVRKYLSPHFYLGTDFSRTNRDSSDLTYSYIESRAMFRAGVVQEPAYKDADFEKADVPPDSRGAFYVGLQTSVTNLGTKLDGSRGSSGMLQADFGGDGWANGAFAGYGMFMGNWFLGLEADVSKGSGGWDHAHTPGERIFSVSRDLEYGLSGVIGRSFTGGTMLYGKAGIVAANFETDYELTPNSVQDRRTVTGLRLGIGGSVPVTREFAFRIEHTFSAFNDYNIDCCIQPPTGTPDNFANNETTTSFGLVYWFGGIPGAAPPTISVDYRSSYAGVQFGHDAFSTWTTGPRETGTTLTADFSDIGYTAGIFGGYGFQFGNFYLGGEIEAELGKSNSDHERDPNGRSFSVEKQWSLGASLRGGYVVNNTALIYARIGVVQSKLQIDYAEGNSSVSATYIENGFRFGGGMEFPTSENIIVRLDYSHTSYPEITLITPPSQETQRYRPQDDVFRAGLLRRFVAN